LLTTYTGLIDKESANGGSTDDEQLVADYIYYTPLAIGEQTFREACSELTVLVYT
jgi:hypothetical protein